MATRLHLFACAAQCVCVCVCVSIYDNYIVLAYCSFTHIANTHPMGITVHSCRKDRIRTKLEKLGVT